MGALLPAAPSIDGVMAARARAVAELEKREGATVPWAQHGRGRAAHWRTRSEHRVRGAVQKIRSAQTGNSDSQVSRTGYKRIRE